MKSTLSPVFGLLLIALTSLGTAQEPKQAEQHFRAKVAPVLQRSCVSCHNPDKSRGGLDLSSREAALIGGDKGPALTPGDAQKSLLYRMVHGPNPKMPRQRDPLTADEVADLARWLDAGAPWPKDVVLRKKAATETAEAWWSLQPLKRPPLPEVKDRAWVKTEIDRFILAKLEAQGLKPSAPADRVTFIRRVTYDLHGLPPTPGEIDAFVNDRSADAFEKLIDRLLASPRYGERWGRHWLDVCHYGDTHGYDKDKRRLWAWLFRDWVIRAFNQDVPYRRFVRAQLAGDVLFPGELDGVVATGFVVAGPWDFVGHVELREGTVDKEKTRTLDRDDMVANALSTFSSLTVHCARCHDHKFDPIPTKDYYRLQAVFAGVERGDRPVVNRETLARKAELETRRQKTAARRDTLLREVAALSSPTLTRLDAEMAELRKQLAALPTPKGAASPTNGYHSAIEKSPDVTKWVQVDLGRNVPLEVIRLIPARPTDFPDTPGFGFPLRFEVSISDDASFTKAVTLLDQARADYPNPGDAALTIPTAGKQARYVRVTARRLWKRTNDYVFALAELEAYSEGRNVAEGAKVTALDSIEAGRWGTKHLVDRFSSRQRLVDTTDPEQRRRIALERKLAAVERQRRREHDALITPAARQELAAATQALAGLDAQLAGLKDSAKVYAVRPIPPRPIHVLQRGDVERKGELVQPGALSLLPGLEHHFAKVKPNDEGGRRAALAHWLTDDQNVLTWRSIVNRVWQYHFGRGLVDTPNDFGRNGSRPTHPELLDWLACEFRDRDSLKRLHKMILLSAAYRQASAHHAEYAKRDVDNRYLWRMNRRRLDAEALRDSVLAVSGKLDLKMFGPGYELFRFQDDHSPIYDHLDVSKSDDPKTFRRTVYRFVVRSVPNPFLESLDCADPNLNVPVRNTTLTALQALALLNNPFMVKQADYFADRLRATSDDPARQIDAAYRLALARPPSPAERAALTAYVREHGLANACRLLLNANEFLFVD